MFEKIQIYLVKYPAIRIAIISGLGVATAWILVGCNVKEDSSERIQHMFDKCVEDKTVTECRVLVEFKR